MGQAASDPIGSARQLPDADLAALWQSQVGADGKMASNVSNARDQDGRSSLHIAASEGKRSAVEVLLKHKAITPSLQDNNLITPLHSAVFRNHAEVALLLLTHGADINAQDTQGLTALHWSVINGAVDCIDLLLVKGADATITNTRSETALDLAQALKPRARERVMPHLKGEAPERQNVGIAAPVSANAAQMSQEFARQTLFAGFMEKMGRDSRKMLALCQLWGIIKYTHPYLAYKLVRWDEDALEATAQHLSEPSSTNKQFYGAIIKLLSKLNDPNTRVMHGHHLLTHERLAADSLDAMAQTSLHAPSGIPSIRLPLAQSSEQPLSSITPQVVYPKVTIAEDKIAIIDCTDYFAFQATSLSSLVQTFASINASSESIVFDVRCLDSSGHSASQISKNATHFGIYFHEAFRALLPEPLVLPLMRQRVYHGLPEHVKMPSSGPSLFEHGFLVGEAVVLQPIVPAAHPAKRRLFSFIIDKHTPVEVIHVAMALQARVQACITMISEKDDCLLSGDRCLVWEPGVQVAEFRLSDIVEGPNRAPYGDIVVQIRQNERVAPDSSIGLRADQLIQVANGQLGIHKPDILATIPNILPFTASKYRQNASLKDPALELALRYCYGQTAKQEIIRHLPFPIKSLELEYKDPELPSKNLRVLALFRLWNAVHFFYPYKHLLPYPWEFAFLKTLKSFVDADSPERYSLAIADLVSTLCDSHAYVKSPYLGYLVGTHVPSIRVKQIGTTTVVTHVAALTGDAPKSSLTPRHAPIVPIPTSSGSISPRESVDHGHHEEHHAHDGHLHIQDGTHSPRASVHSPSTAHIVLKKPQKEASTSSPAIDGTATDGSPPPVAQLGVQVGDILVAIDGVPVEQRRDKLAALFSLSTSQAKKWRTDMKLLAGAEGSTAKLTLKRQIRRILDVPGVSSASGDVHSHADSPSPHGHAASHTPPAGQSGSQPPQFIEIVTEVPRVVASQVSIPRTGPVVNVLEINDYKGQKIGYLDLTRLNPSQVDKAIAQLLVPGIGAIVFDLRGPTRGTIFRIAPHLATHTTHVATTKIPLLLPSLNNSAGDTPTSLQLLGHQTCLPAVPLGSVTGAAHVQLIQNITLVALVNEDTQSHGEYAAAVLKAVRPDIQLFGTPSSGSLGHATNIPVPGGILVGFTALGILRADGTDIQTKGIQPDHIVLERTESVLTGKDDFMEAAIDYLKRGPAQAQAAQ